ncbi:glycosyltransferase [Streptomyces sp. NPDC056254]|uniref:glycosyltransferase n=1 Tax=Streptomyces sp. NPDC056254 TaxID=3345763 RepID=UPI0035DF0588
MIARIVTSNFSPRTADARVLHVTEACDVGVAETLATYLAATPHLEHWLVTAIAPPDVLGRARLAGILPLPDGHRARLRAVGDIYQQLQPDRVHAHGSQAGIYVRLNRIIPTRTIVYTPHCYAFERQDVSAARRVLYAFSEYALASRAATVAASSRREYHLAARLHRTNRIIHVPYVPPLTDLSVSLVDNPGSLPIAVAIGPLSPQRDPLYFAQTVASAPNAAHWVWAGEGDKGIRRVLEDVGVHVTGSLSSRKMAELLRTAAVYVHTAAWEDNSSTLLRAAHAGLPVAARHTRALEALRVPDLVRSPQDLATAALRLAVVGPERTDHRTRLLDALQLHSDAATQASRISEAYKILAPRAMCAQDSAESHQGIATIPNQSQPHRSGRHR